uniref:U-box domain-containing protein n=1 Tax=Leersia perrieri TaxID=77586 RepID=A0A0D9W576_9ORYZ
MSIPHLFRCPISLDIFTDPVTLCTGQTYDRPCIERWLAAGHRTCPVTMQPLAADADLIPNRTLRHLIERWLSTDHTHPSPSIATDAEADAAGDEPSLAALKRRLQQPEHAAAALRKAMALASESDVGRASMLQLGFLPVLLRLVFDTTPPASCRAGGEAVEEMALQCALLLMPPSNASPQLACLNDALKSEAALASLVRLLERDGGRTTRASLCRLLETVATASATKNDAGGIGGGGVAGALAAVEALATTEAGRRAVAREAGATRALVRHVFVMNSGNEGSEHAVAALVSVCGASRAARAEAAAAGVVTQLLLLLQSQCGARAKAKARSLLKLLKSM